MDAAHHPHPPVAHGRLKALRERVLSGFPADDGAEFVDAMRSVLAGECFSISDLRRVGQPLVFVSDGFLALTGFHREEALGRELGFLMRDDTDQDEVRSAREAVQDGRAATVLVRCYRSDGSLFWNEQRHYPVKDARGRVAHAVVLQRDVSDVVHARSAEEVTRQMATSLRGDGAFFSYGAIIDAHRHVRLGWVQEGARAVLGRTAKALQGVDLRELIAPDDRARVHERLLKLCDEGGSRRDRYRMLGADGRVRWVEDFAAVSWRADEAQLVAVHGVVRDVTSETLRRHQLGPIDPLTGLPTGRVLADRLDQAVRQRRRNGGVAALVLLELDHFDFVHQTMHPSRAERFVSEATRHLQRALRRSDTLALVRPACFGVVLPDLPDADAVVPAVEKLLAWVARPFMDGTLRVELSASAGVAVAPGDGHRAEVLRAQAETALQRARVGGGSRFAFADLALDQAADARLRFERELRAAFAHDQLVLHFQPRVRLGDGSEQCVEALVRWRHPERGLLLPHEFLPALYRAHLGDALFAWVLEQAMAQAAAWRDQGTPRRVSINVGPAQLERDDVGEVVRAALERWQLHPALLELELHEATGMRVLERGAEQLATVRRYGVTVALDDFGAVATDFARLRDLPIDTLKIDRSFVARVGDGADSADVALLRALVGIGHGLGLRVVAEGIETAAQRARVSEMAVHEGQGYLFSRALPGDLITASRPTTLAHATATQVPVG